MAKDNHGKRQIAVVLWLPEYLLTKLKLKKEGKTEKRSRKNRVNIIILQRFFQKEHVFFSFFKDPHWVRCINNKFWNTHKKIKLKKKDSYSLLANVLGCSGYYF